ncbi:hypothetical protein Tco_0465832 [Tanacetum coccineum]
MLYGGICFHCKYDTNPNSLNFSDYPPQPQYETNICELCGNDAHNGYDCPPQVPFVYNQNPWFDQNFDNNFPLTSPNFSQQNLVYENYGGPHATFQCQPMNQNFDPNFCDNPIYSGFDQYQPPQFFVTQRSNKDMLLEMAKVVKNNRILLSMGVLLAKERILKLIQVWDENQIKSWRVPELLLQLLDDSRTINESLKQHEEKRIEREQAANLAVQEEQEEQATQSFLLNWNFPMVDDDEYTIIYRSSKSITPDLPTEEPDTSLSMGDEHLGTNLETESDEVIKSSVENLVPNSREFEGISDDSCDVPFCENSPPLDVFNEHFDIFSNFNDDSNNGDSFENIDYVEASSLEDSLIIGNEELSTILEKESDEFIKSSFSPISIFEEKSVTFSNPLFNSNDDFTSSDDESLSDEDVPEDNVKTYSNPLFEFDDEYISSDVNPLFDEVLKDIECMVYYDSNFDESTFLVTPLSDSNEDEFFTPSDDVELLLHHDPSISVVSIL